MPQRIITEEPETETWRNQEYAERDIDGELRNLTNRKAHGSDGIPVEAYKATSKWTIAPIAEIMHQIKEGQAIPENWTIRPISYIYKNKGGPIECGNYRPICFTQIIYRIWPGLIARKLTKITHILTSNDQYGYKEGISAIAAIIKIEQYRTCQ